MRQMGRARQWRGFGNRESTIRLEFSKSPGLVQISTRWMNPHTTDRDVADGRIGRKGTIPAFEPGVDSHNAAASYLWAGVEMTLKFAQVISVYQRWPARTQPVR
jgi:hypothetical protein